MVATLSARFTFPRNPSPRELLQQARRLTLAGYATQAVATCRTALETAAFELALRFDIRAKRGLWATVDAVSKHLGKSKKERRRLRYICQLANCAAHGIPCCTADAVALCFAVESFVEAVERKGVAR